MKRFNENRFLERKKRNRTLKSTIMKVFSLVSLAICTLGSFQLMGQADNIDLNENRFNVESIDAVMEKGMPQSLTPVAVYSSNQSHKEDLAANQNLNSEGFAQKQFSELENDFSKPSIQSMLEPKSYDPIKSNRERFLKSPCFSELGFDPYMDPDAQERLYQACEKGKTEKEIKKYGIILVLLLIGGGGSFYLYDHYKTKDKDHSGIVYHYRENNSSPLDR